MMPTRLPLPKSSGLRPPAKAKTTLPTVKAPAKSVTTDNLLPAKTDLLIPNRLKRRSKSMTDVREVLVPKLGVKSARPPGPSRTPMSSITLNKPRTASKRPAIDKIEEVKPKITKKIPEWDYKGRFQQLQERHATLQENARDMKTKLEGYDKLLETERDHNRLKAEHKLLRSELELLEKADQKLKELITNFNVLEEQRNDLAMRLETTSKNHAASQQTIKKLDEEIIETKTKLQESEEKREKLEENLRQVTLEGQKNEIELTKTNLKFETLYGEHEKLKIEVEMLKSELQSSAEIRRNLHNTIQDLKGNIRVFCRVRGALPDEQSTLQCYFNFVDEATMEIRKSRETSSKTELKQEFTFDKIFPPKTSQKEVFEELSQLVQSALDGFHVSVFAYGQTGSGKTYTMQGGALEDQGMIPRSVDLIFESIQKLESFGWKYNVQASFLEIYNENIHDLLNINSKMAFDIRYNEGKGTTVTNLTIQPMKSAEELKNFMKLALKNRAVAATDFNEHSSRSHAVTKLYLEGIHEESKTIYSGSLNLVDLAGSESAKTSHADRINETKNINKSLSALGSVMLALYNKDAHVPYRNSKLTYLLQSCLGGNSKTLMFVNVAPFDHCYHETINSARFAAKVKEVKMDVKRNKGVVSS